MSFLAALVVRSDLLNTKGMAVNRILKLKYAQRQYGYCDNDNIEIKDLNKSGLHLTNMSSWQLATNFINFIELWYTNCMHANSRHPLSCQEETKNLPDINDNYNKSQIHDPDNHESINLDYAPLNVNNVVESLPYDPQLVLKRIW